MSIETLLETIMSAILSGFIALSGFFGLQATPASTPAPESPRMVEQKTAPGDPDSIVATSTAEDTNTVVEQIAPATAVPSAQTAAHAQPTSLAERIERSLVNVFCTYKNDESIYTATGSGVFIDSQGVILTNAHVAQFLLLAVSENAFDARCYIRTGDPAVAKYQANLLYISPLWVRQNATLIDTPHPTGTGERDFALLYVTHALEGALPETFPALSISTTPRAHLTGNDPVLIGGYPADILRREGPDAALPPIITDTTVTNAYTFNGADIDVISLASSTIGAPGSSGGPVVTTDGLLIGLITTRGATSDEGMSLRALTLAYINRTITEETGFGLLETLTGNLAARAEIFADALVPFLSELIENEL